MTMSEFKQKGGVLGGRGERYDAFEGEPKHIGGTIANMMEGHKGKRDSSHDEELRVAAMHGDFDPLDGGKSNTGAAIGHLGSTNPTAEEANRTATRSQGFSTDAPRTSNVSRTEEQDLRKSSATNEPSRQSNATVDRGSKHPGSSASGTSKVSFMDKLNPRKDADGDGKAGFLD